MATKLDWLTDVVKVLRATPPPFPGETDQAYAVLEKTINYAYSLCFNGGKVGADGCPVCRAYRTEVAEAQAASSLTASQAALKRADAAEKAAELAEAEKEALAEALEGAQAVAKAARSDAQVASDVAAEAIQARDEALQERASAQRSFADSESARIDREAANLEFQTQVETARKLTEQLAGVLV